MAAVGMGDTPLALTEVNITWEGDPETSTLEASPGTFYAGLWAADTFGVALEAGLWSYAFWSISEGWTLGLLDGDQPRPIYHMIKMYADFFGSNTVGVAEKPEGFSVYASRNDTDESTVVMGDSDQVVHVDGLDGEKGNIAYQFPAYSISAVVIPDAGDVRIRTYRETDGDEGPKQVI
jgi:hypothetical protein